MKPTIKTERLDVRTLSLRQKCLTRKSLAVPWDGDPRICLESLQASKHISSWTIRRGLLTRDLLAGFCFELDDEEILVGRPSQDREAWQKERSQAVESLRISYPNLFLPGQTGHCQLDLSQLFELGIDGLFARIEENRNSSDVAQYEVYQSFLDALEGLATFIENAAGTAERSLKDLRSREPENHKRLSELGEMASICRSIAHLPPRTFREALQLTWLVILGVQWADRAALVVPGHLDRILGKFYQDDVSVGRLTPEFALLLIESIYILINEYVPDGLAVSVMVGGRDAEGNDLTNPLSYLCLEGLRRTRLVYPTVGVCWHNGTPASLSELAIELIAQGIANPAFFGDETIQEGLRMYGVPPEESWDYINSTCVEITPVGSSNVWVASPYFSINQILLDEIGAQIKSESEATSFDGFLKSYQTRLAEHIRTAVEVENENRQKRMLYGGKPLQSVFTRDCVTSALDIDRGGARYNWVECSFVGLANLADGLYVIKEEVFEQKRMTLAEMVHILEADFEGYELVQKRFMNAYPKYGNDRFEVDRLVETTVQFLRTECEKHQMVPDGSAFVPGAFCWVMHEHLGRLCGATPDGRRAGFPFADGCGGAQGREKTGPTAAVLSVTNWDSTPMIGGAAFNMKFGASLFRSAESRKRLHELVTTFLERGGFETQVNVVDAEILKRAQSHPEEYQDLVVRIGGYTDYFTRLTPEMQAEVILRTEYENI